MIQKFQCAPDEEHLDTRLDKYLSGALPQLSRARLQQLIRDGHVTRNGLVLANPSQKVKAGDRFEVTEPETKALDLTPANIPLSIIYEDDALLVIDKPPGMTVHPAPGAGNQTLVHALLAHCAGSLSGIGGVARPGIVHRIDKDTSGLLVVAKTDAAHHSLSAQLKERTLKRTYYCLAWGAPSPRVGSIDAPVARHKQKRKQMAVVEGGKHAVTHYTVAEQFRAPRSITPLASKIFCQLETGRTHQIRVHLAHRQAPLIGDGVYGVSTISRLNKLKSSGIVLPEETLHTLREFHRQALHAQELEFFHPISGNLMHFSAPIPADLMQVEAALTGLTKPE